MAKLSVNEYVEVVRRSGLVEGPKLEKVLASLPNNGSTETIEVAQKLIDAKLITPWQNDKLMQGKHSGFVLGKYKLLSHISSGGMSSVYLAEHVLMQRRVAVKVLPPARLDDSSFRERFHLECQVMAALDHPNIVRAHDFDVDGKLHYLVMEYIDGPDLEGVVRKQGPLPFELAANYTRQAADGLGHAHDAGLIHRDMKPANLLVDQRGCIKVLDLGVARITGANDSTSLTLAHKEDVVGTADFLAPEQAINSHNVDFRADIYALGGTFYYMLTGHGPFPDGTMAQKLLAHQTQEPSPISKERPDCPPGLAAILLRMMAKKLKARYQTMREVSDDLGRWLADTSYVPAKPGKAPAAAPKPVAAAVEEPLALEERDRESVDFPLNNLTNVRPNSGGTDPGPLNSSEDEADGYGLVDLDDSVDEDQSNLYGDNAVEDEPEQEEIAEEPAPADEDLDDSSQEVMATKKTETKKGDGFWDDVLNQIDEPAKDKSKSPAAKAPEPVKVEAKKSEPKAPERPKPIEALKPIEKPKSPEKSKPADKPEKSPSAEKPFSPKSSALVPAGKRDLATVGKKDDKSPGSKSEKDKDKDKTKSEKDKPKTPDKLLDDLKGPKSKRKVVLDSCPACSADLNEGSPICPKCGFNTVTGAKSDGPMKPMARPKMDDEEEKDNLKLLKNPYVLGGVAILLVILIAAMVMMGGSSPSTTQIDPALLPPLPPKPITNPNPNPNPPVPQPGGNNTKPNPPQPGGNNNPPDVTPKPPDPAVAGHKKPESLDKWGEEDFYWAAATGEVELFDALKLLLSARKGDPDIEAMLVKLLEPSRLVAAGATPPVPLNDKVLLLLTESFITGGTTGKQAIKNILDGKIVAKNDDAYLDAALSAMLAHPNPEWNQLIIESYFTPEKHRPAQNAEGVNAEGLRKKVMMQFAKTNVQIRTEFGKRLNDRTLPPAVVTEMLGKLSDTSPANVPAQVELFLTAKLTPVQDEAFQNNFIIYGQTALDVLMAGKPLTEGSPAMAVDEAQAIATALWQDKVTKAVWDRFRAISDASKEKEQRNLLKLSSQLPITSARAEMAGLIERFWKNLDPVGWAENNADFGAGWGDPALWVTVKSGPERVLATNRNAPPKIENKWFNASRQYLKVLNQRFYAAALARPSDPSLEAKRPIKPHDGAKVTAEFRMEWPQDLAGKVAGAGPLVVHYIRVEERGNLQDLDRNHYYKALTPFPKRRTLQQTAGVEDARWLDGIREADGKIYTMDVLFTRLRPVGVPSGDEELIIEILQMEIPK